MDDLVYYSETVAREIHDKIHDKGWNVYRDSGRHILWI